MDKKIQADLYRYNELTGFYGLLKGMKIPGFRFTYFLRIASKHKKSTVKGVFSRLILHWLSFRYGYQINAKTKIGKGFYIGHFGTVLAGEGVTIGSNCNIAHNVTIGEVPFGVLRGVPTIGDKVWMGTGSVIVGKITIGSNVLIAPNALVNFNVPSNCMVIGNPAKVIHLDHDPTFGYINNTLD